LHAIAGPNVSDHRGRFGNALLTRFPVRLLQHINLSVGSYEARGAIDAEVLAHGRRLRVVVTHLGLHAGERRQQIARLLDALVQKPVEADAMIIMGDLNEWRGRRGGIPALDRIYAGGGASLTAVAVHRSPLARLASDHLPLCAAVDWVAASELMPFPRQAPSLR
ncbi:MAG TPA: endonuclease/exonuclease/phosphatase family protein, partial [Stellaceae bacterium]|nr:endonuclease/exonuclease/phosphatase family protein [Stellaceae bacterium]